MGGTSALQGWDCLCRYENRKLSGEFFINIFLLIQADLANWMHMLHLASLEDLEFKLALLLARFISKATLEFWPENVSTDTSQHIFQLADVC